MSKGHRVVLGDVGAYVQRNATGQHIKMQMQGNVWVMCVKMFPAAGQQHKVVKMEVDALHMSDFIGQEGKREREREEPL